jgi:predicted O-methyltransferase YrrM
MATSALDRARDVPFSPARLASKLWREVSRPFRAFAPIESAPQAAPAILRPAASAKPYLTGSGAGVEGFHPLQATVEPEGIPLIQRLVRASGRYPGPIIEIGTLLGTTTTHMALAKAPHQKIITVDLYCWNPWGLAREVHEALAAEMLRYLVETGHVERVTIDKNDFYRGYQGPPPALVFLDAWHDYAETKKDLQWAKTVGAKIVAGHDYCDAFPGVKRAVDEFGGPRELAGSVWLL